MACFRVDYCGRGELADRQQKLNQFLSKLTHMAEEFNVCVLMVRIDPSLSLFISPGFAKREVKIDGDVKPEKADGVCVCVCVCMCY